MSSSKPNPNVSNGTCYYSENTLASSQLVPCGNDAFQTWPCCYLGDFCLGLDDSNACWNAATGNTYVAGCTDPTFTAPECIHKPAQFHDQEWVAINNACKNLNTTDGITNWTGCKVDNNSTELFKLPQASCTPYCSTTDIVYAGSSSLAPFASLPTFAGSSIFWQSDYTPPTTIASGYAPDQTTATGSSTPTSTSSSTPSDDSSSGLSTGAKAGIGVGAGVGGLILIALVWFTCVAAFRARERQRQRQGLGQQPPYNQMPPGPGMSMMPPPPGAQAGHGYQYSQDTTQYAPSNVTNSPYGVPVSQWSPGQDTAQAPVGGTHFREELEGTGTGYKHELPADETFPTRGETVSPVLSSSPGTTLAGHSPIPGVAEVNHELGPGPGTAR